MAWDDDLAATDAAVAGYFDTVAFTAVPMTKPPRAANAEPIPDTDRSAFDFFGSLDIEPEFSSLSSANRPSPGDRQIRSVRRLCLTALTTAWPWLLRQGDHVRTASALYVVAAVPDQDGTPRMAYWLNKVSS